MNDVEPVRDSQLAVGHEAAVELYWIPLGARAHVVRLSGKRFEAVTAVVAHRRRCDLYHSALLITTPEGCFVTEQAPVSDQHGENRGVVADAILVGLESRDALGSPRCRLGRWAS